jgi:uncharacterized membrane protein YfcA
MEQPRSLLPEITVLYAQLFLFGVCIGIFSGLFGIGGGIVLVPGLVLLFHFSQQEAQGTSLAALSVPILIFAALVYYQNGKVQLPVVAAVALGMMIGAVIGAVLVTRLPVAWLQFGFGGLLLYLGFKFVLGDLVPKHFAAALPAGLAAVLAAIGGWMRGRRAAAAARLPPPDSHTEYHI